MKQYLTKIYKGTQVQYFKLLDKDIQTKRKRFIVTVNPETIMVAEDDASLHQIMLDRRVSKVPDGIAIIKAGRLLGINFQERIPGIEIATYLLEKLNQTHKTLYLFGAEPKVLDHLVKKIQLKYPNIKIIGFSDGYVANKDEVFQQIIKLKPDVCLVALGIPLQEKLIYKYIQEFNQGIFIGVGGAFDILSGLKKRAPKILIKLNLEWLYRILKEPRRFKKFRQQNLKFLFKIHK